MKAFITLLMVAAIATTGCKKDKGVDCIASLNKLTKAGEAFSNTQTKENCQAYKAALQEYINSSCFSGLSQEQKDNYKESVNALECE